MARLSFLVTVILLGATWHGAPPGPSHGETGRLTGSLGAAASAGAADTASTSLDEPSAVSLMRVEGPISPVTTNHIERAIAEAREGGSQGLVIEIDTPGGLLQSTYDIVRLLFQSDVPIVVYVSPAGARAASAGTFITLAAHVAAMAPSTSIGAASPVTMSPGAQADTVMQAKLFSDAESFIENIAERRGRNVEWAISAVRDAASITEREALELEVIDLIADGREDLLRALEGRVVDGDTLRTEGASIMEIPRNLAERFLGMLIRPETMLILMLVAVYGIMGEVTNPGAIVPGVAGVIALVLLLYASAAMPINVAGYLLLALAIALFIAEAFTPTYGLLLGAGAVAFFLGALMLFQDFPEAMELPWGWLIPATLLTVAFFVWIASAGIKAQFAEGRTGVEAMAGHRAEVVDPVSPRGGRVFVDGEYWHAVSEQEIPEGQPCEVVAVEGLTVRVRPVASSEPVSSDTS